MTEANPNKVHAETPAQSAQNASRTAATIPEAVSALKQGKAVVFPTDTVYGVGVAIDYADSPEEIYRIKERSHKKPVAWLVNGVDALTTYGKMVPDSVMRLAKNFWPGPLTIIVAASDKVPKKFQSEEGTIGLRAPANATAQKLIQSVGCPLSTSSANLAGEPAPHSFEEVNPVILERCACALSDNTEKSGIASTVIDCSSGAAVMVRQGALTIADIKKFC